jgi:thiamine kinase-like enzyme
MQRDTADRPGATPLLDRIRALPCWQGRITAEPLAGGITNVNYVVQDGARRFVVRVGADIAVHHILRFNELAASLAAHAAGISPAVRHHEPGLLVLDWVEGRSLVPADVRAPGMADRVTDLLRRVHRDVAAHLRGPVLAFWPFHVLRDYAATLAGGRHAADLPGHLADAALLESAVGPVTLVFGHNDLLPANVIDDGSRLWLIDWDYAGFTSPLFDLGGLAANNGLSAVQECSMLERYFDRAPDPALWRSYRAMKAAAALREAMWSMVQETHSTLDVDFVTYTATSLSAYRAAMAEFQESAPA